MSWQLSHLVNNSWLPVFFSLNVFFVMVSILFWFKFGSFILLVGSFILLVGSFILWFRDIVRESTFQGVHSLVVQMGLKWGLFWFLFSEVFFFFSVFWTFFHFSVSPLTGLNNWPLFGLSVILPFQVPLLNTLILLVSGVTATYGHLKILKNENNFWLVFTVILGLYFLSIQFMEYFYSYFSFMSGVYGSVFFFGTGFHGLHVCLGVILILVSTLRLFMLHFSGFHHFGLEFSLWYWHFVDMVWLFLFIFVYFWGS